MHARVSGLADYLAEDEHDAIRIGRRIVARLNWRKRGDGLEPDSATSTAGVRRAGRRPRRAARPDPGRPQGAVRPARGDRPDRRRRRARRNGRRLRRVQAALRHRRWSPAGRELHGRPIGILANAQGVLFSEEAQKATQFIQLANQTDTPLLFLHNTTGYMVGKDYEQGGIIKHGAMMINAVSNSTVPHLSVIMGASYGAGNYGMNGRAFDPRFLFTWPSAKSAVMGPAQLAGVLEIVARQSAESKGETFDAEGFQGVKDFVEALGRGAVAAATSSPGCSTTTASSTRATPAPSSASACRVIDERADRGHRPIRGVPDHDHATAGRQPGEIARRVFRTCRRLGIETVAVHSDADAGLPYVREADHAVRLPGNAPADTYLRIDLILEAARRTGRRRDPPGLRLPVRERRLRPRRHRRRADLGRAGARVDRGDGLQDRGQGDHARGRRARRSTAPDRPDRGRPPAAGEGVRRRRWPRHAGRPHARPTCAGEIAAAEAEAAVGLRRRHRLRRAVRRARPPRRGAGRRRRRGGASSSATATARSSAATRRSSRRRRRPACTDERPSGAARGGRARPPRRSATAAPARSSSSTTRRPSGSSSWR